MKSNKNVVYELIHKCTYSVTGEEANGVSTQYLSKRLGIQRTNISTILNVLTKEGKIEKINGRPVLYRVKKDLTNLNQEASCFKQLIGSSGSLKNAVQLAKAAVLYPGRSLHSLILGQMGCGKSFFASLMYEFAKENAIISENAPFIKFNCLNYSDNPEQMEYRLFGVHEDCMLQKAEGGVLFLDNIELLPADARNKLVQMVENNIFERSGIKKDLNVILIAAMNDFANRTLIEHYSKYFSIKIPLIPLHERNFKERFQLVQYFFTIEAERSGKTININPEILIGLLLYPCEANVKQLKRDIQLGCANAYVREFNSEKEEIIVYMSDFPYYIRSGFLNFKAHKSEIKEIIAEDCNYVFSKEKAARVASGFPLSKNKRSMYDWIDEKANELSERGIQENDINLILSIDIENEFKHYSRSLGEQIIDKEQLSQIVDEKVIQLVSEFLDEATAVFNKVYPVSVFYGVCLHLNSTIKKRNMSQRLNNNQIMEIIKNNGNEYGFCLKFIGVLEQEFNLKLPIDEVVFLTLFLTKVPMTRESVQHPVILVALHGDSAAKSIVDVVNSMSVYPAYSYDMAMDKSTSEAYAELKKYIVSIHKGKGIFVLYDMGSFKTMFDMISIETGIEIKSIEIPITLLALDCSRKIMLGMSLEDIYHDLNGRGYYEGIENNGYYRVNSKYVILSLCMTGEGGALQTQKYLEKQLNTNEIEIIALSVSDEKKLLEEVNQIKEKHNVLCAVGSFDPQLIGIQFVPITDVFQNQCKEIKQIISFIENNKRIQEEQDEDFEVIFDHLEEELKKVDVSELRKYLPLALKNFIQKSGAFLAKEQELALMIHVSCCIENIKEGKIIPLNRNRELIISDNPDMYHCLKQEMAEIEEKFQISFDDNELSNIISIINLSKGIK